MPTHGMTLRAGDKVENAEGRIGLVLSIRRDSECNCLAIAWDNHNVLLYSRMETLDVELVARGDLQDGQDFLPSAALSSFYTVPDPSNWLVMALIGWHSERAKLERIEQHGLKGVEDLHLAMAACRYIRGVLDRMRGVVIDFTQN